MNLSLRGWIAAFSLVGMFAWANMADAAQAESAKPEANKVEAEKAAPATPDSGEKPATAEKPAAAEKPAEEAKPAEAVKPAAASEEKPATEQPAAEKSSESKDADHGASAKGESAAADAKHDEPKHDDAGHNKAGHGDAGHGGGNGHHDPTDLSHANDGPGHANLAPRALTGIQELKADLAIYTFIVFLLLAAVLLKFGWKPIMSGLDKREQSIRDLIAQTERNAAQAEATLKKHEALLATAADEIRELKATAHRDIEKQSEEILAKAHADASRDRERALADIEVAKTVALREIAQKSVNTAVGLAGRILQREVSAADHVQLINDALEKFPSRN